VPSTLRILLHDYSGHAFPVQLSRELARRGHRVLHLHCPSYRTGKGALEPRPGDPPTLRIDSVPLDGEFEKYSPLKRLRQELQYGRRLARRLAPFEPDVVLSGNTPLFAQASFFEHCRRLGKPFVFWQQDIYSVAMQRILAGRVPLVGGVAGRAFIRLERRMLRGSAAVVTISADFVPTLARWGVPSERVHVVENWAPLDELPDRPRDNAWAREHGLVGRQVLLYSGTLGLKHDPDLLLQLARRLSRREEVRVVVISEGLGADWLRERAGGLHNLVQLPFQPYERLPDVLASGDVLLVILEPDAGIYSVPSKVLSYHCARRALLAAIPGENLAARLLRASGGGVVVEPADAEGFAAAAAQLLDDAGRRAEMGTRARAYAEQTFDIRLIGDRFESVLRSAL